MRLLADILLFIGAFFLPWWLVLPCAFVLFFVFPSFYEVLLLALLMDLLYGIEVERLFNFQFVLSVGATCVVLLLTFVKKQMRV